MYIQLCNYIHIHTYGMEKLNIRFNGIEWVKWFHGVYIDKVHGIPSHPNVSVIPAENRGRKYKNCLISNTHWLIMVNIWRIYD